MNPTRRTFLGALAGGAAWAALPPAARAGAAVPKRELGFSLYAMKDLALTDALQACAKIGYRNVEVCLLPGYPTAPETISAGGRRALREELAARGLTVSGAMIDIRLAATAEAAAKHAEVIRTAAQLSHDLQPAAPPLLETVLGGRPAEWDAIKERMRDRLQMWAEIAKRADIVIAIKAHVSSAVNSPERLLWLLREVESKHLCAAYDYSHFALHGWNLEDTLAPLVARTKFIHVKDAGGDLAKPQFLLPGEGTIDYVAYFRALARAKWNGPIVVEVSSQLFRQPGYDAIAAAKKSFAALDAAVRRAG